MRAGIRGASFVVVAVCGLVAGLAAPAVAAGGKLDSTLGGDGRVTTDLTRLNDEGRGVAIQSNGQIVVVGTSDANGGRFAVARYNANGSLDTTFGGGDGVVRTDFSRAYQFANGVAIQPDGRIVVVGGSSPNRGHNAKVAIARYNTDGTLDGTFSGDGKVVTNITHGYDYAEDVVITGSDEILVSGSAAGRFLIARYTTGGALDTTFSGDGKVTTNFDTGFDVANAIGIDSNGNIVAAGWAGRKKNYRFAAARYTSAGALDSSFSGDGKASTNFTSGNDYAWDMAIQPDGKIVLVGQARRAGGRFALVRYRTGGSLDPTFGGDGTVITNVGRGWDVLTGVALDANGNIVTSGWSGNRPGNRFRFAVARYSPAGAPDGSFAGDGIALTKFSRGVDYAWDLAIQGNGAIVVAGRADLPRRGRFAVARYLAA